MNIGKTTDCDKKHQSWQYRILRPKTSTLVIQHITTKKNIYIGNAINQDKQHQHWLFNASLRTASTLVILHYIKVIY